MLFSSRMCVYDKRIITLDCGISFLHIHIKVDICDSFVIGMNSTRFTIIVSILKP